MKRTIIVGQLLTAHLVCVPAFSDVKPHLQALSGRQVQPSRAASYSIVDDRIVLTSDWMLLGHATPREFYHVAAFDAAEHENINGVLGGPTDNVPGCSALIPAGSRWFLGAAFTNPFISSDLQTGPRGAGAACEALSFSWYIDVAADPPETVLYIAIHTFENMDVVGCTDDGSGLIDGVIYEFPPQPWDPGFFNWANFNLNGTGLVHTMPADGVGGYQLIFAIDYNPVTGELTLPTGIDPVTQLGVAVQPMLWGTGNNEPIDDRRMGVDVDGQFDDDQPTNGEHDLSLECYSYLFGPCTDPLSPSITFWMKDDPTACECDLDGNRVVTTEDLAIFLASFGTNAPNIPTPAADFDASGGVDLSDLALFLSCFAYVCP